MYIYICILHIYIYICIYIYIYIYICSNRPVNVCEANESICEMTGSGREESNRYPPPSPAVL